jgi:CRISPR-associated protein Cmr4
MANLSQESGAMGKALFIGMLAETAIHVGAGQSIGVVDLPVAREGATGLPHIPDSGLKGALRQWAETVFSEPEVKILFGSAESGGGGGAGVLLISTARLLFLPVRRLDGPYAWVTTPYLLERLRRDASRSGAAIGTVPIITVSGTELLIAGPPQSPVFLEEYVFTAKKNPKTTDIDALVKALVADAPLAARLAQQAAIMTDTEFAWFAENALPVDAHNQLSDTKLSQNLWYEEVLPPDTLLFSMILTRHDDEDELVTCFAEKLRKANYLQVGGNESTGQGWFRLTITERA